MTTILLTGAAGFIGFQLSEELLCRGHRVIAVDNLGDNAIKSLKLARLDTLGIRFRDDIMMNACSRKNLHFLQLDLRDKDSLSSLFNRYSFDLVIHLAAKTGVRNSSADPHAYIDNNIFGFHNLLECCRNFDVKKLLFASSSSVYGANKHMPFSEEHPTSQPTSMYAVTKKTNELMAYNYARSCDLSTVGLRLFTVYGPWNRTDMAVYMFIKAIEEGSPIKLFNGGNLYRDFTYVNDVVEAIIRSVNVLESNQLADDNEVPFQLFNVGNGQPVLIRELVSTIEDALDKPALIVDEPMQEGDLYKTFADNRKLYSFTDYTPSTDIVTGIEKTVEWYTTYHRKISKTTLSL